MRVFRGPGSKKRKKRRKKLGFYDSEAWLKLRYRVLKFYGRKCMLCGETDCVIQVDHIRPRSKFPELELEFSNMQVLCKPCNKGKSNIDDTDWRPKPKTKLRKAKK